MSATYEQTPSPQETQFAGVLQMGVQELRDYVETALQENPVFELSDPGEEMLEDPNFARKREWLEAGDWQDSYYQGQDEEDGSRDPLSRMGYYLSDENDLSRFVLSQFIGTKLEPEVLQAVELLCDRLDDDGFLSEDPAELAASLGVSDGAAGCRPGGRGGSGPDRVPEFADRAARRRPPAGKDHRGAVHG